MNELHRHRAKAAKKMQLPLAHQDGISTVAAVFIYHDGNSRGDNRSGDRSAAHASSFARGQKRWTNCWMR